MTRTATAIRRTIRAAIRTATALVTHVRGHRFRLIADLYRAIDTGTQVVIGYRKTSGEHSRRAVRPIDLRATAAGDIVVRAFDHRDGEDTTFRVDRITSHHIVRAGLALAA